MLEFLKKKIPMDVQKEILMDFLVEFFEVFLEKLHLEKLEDFLGSLGRILREFLVELLVNIQEVLLVVFLKEFWLEFLEKKSNGVPKRNPDENSRSITCRYLGGIPESILRETSTLEIS